MQLGASAHGDKLVIQIRNEAGKNHAKGLALQEKGDSITSAIAAQNDMGSTESTFLGSKEIEQAAAAMKQGASTELRFEENSVLFSLEMDLQEASSLEIDSALPPLPPGVKLICVGTARLHLCGCCFCQCVLLLLASAAVTVSFSSR